MTEKLTYCGYRCDLCLACSDNVAKQERRQELSDGWFKYFGFRIEPEKIVCEGCKSADNPRLIDTACPVRPCVISRGFANCAECDEYICDKLKQRIVDRENVSERLNLEIPEEEYQAFIRPYENRKRLDALRHQTIEEEK